MTAFHHCSPYCATVSRRDSLRDQTARQKFRRDRLTLIQEWRVTRNIDSRTHPPRFKSCAPAGRRGLFQQHRNKADILGSASNVRFRGQSGHSSNAVTASPNSCYRRHFVSVLWGGKRGAVQLRKRPVGLKHYWGTKFAAFETDFNSASLTLR